MSREPIQLDKVRARANMDVSSLIASVLRLCDELEQVTAERDKLREDMEKALDVLCALAGLTPADADGACEFCGWTGLETSASHECSAQTAREIAEGYVVV
jgi:hypothetical protein